MLLSPTFPGPPNENVRSTFYTTDNSPNPFPFSLFLPVSLTFYFVYITTSLPPPDPLPLFFSGPLKRGTCNPLFLITSLLTTQPPNLFSLFPPPCPYQNKSPSPRPPPPLLFPDPCYPSLFESLNNPFSSLRCCLFSSFLLPFQAFLLKCPLCLWGK